MGLFAKFKEAWLKPMSFDSLNEGFYDDLEEALILADVGMDTAVDAVAQLKKRAYAKLLTHEEDVKNALRDILAEKLSVGDPALDLSTRPSVALIIGVNGVGKTTLSRCLCGLLREQAGTVRLHGRPLGRKERQRAAFCVMQDVNHQLFTEDVLDELLLSMGGEDEKADTARAKEILNSLDLLDKVKLHPMSLSGGEKQRVAIGSAVASDKKILIFDEPTSGLDYRHMLEVSDNLNRLKEMGKSLFLITHDPELIYKCCTYLLFIQGSKVLWHRPMDGKAVELLRTFFSHEQETGAVNAS